MAEEAPPFRIQNVFHPSDFSETSQLAFAHALKIALAGKLELTLFHVLTSDEDLAWEDFPATRETLKRWRLTSSNSPRELIGLGIKVLKMATRSPDPESAMLEHLGKKPADLIVLATQGRKRPWDIVRKRIAAPLARHAGTMTLFVREGARGFVAIDDGAVALETILVPVDEEPSPELALEAAEAAVHALATGPVKIVLLHVGAGTDLPEVRPPTPSNWVVETDIREGDVVEQILSSAKDHRADLIVMTTAGRHGFLDALRGSTSERVVELAPCPVLTIPEFWAPSSTILNAGD